MKHALTAVLLALTITFLAGNEIMTYQVDQHPEIRYYKITFEIDGNADELYSIQVIPYKTGRELTQLGHLTGDGIERPCLPQKNLQVFWNPELDGYETDGWKFRISYIAISKKMVFVEGGEFNMGSLGGSVDEKPIHKVAVSTFWIGEKEITQREWMEVMGANKAKFKGDDLPAVQITWKEAVEYCNKRSMMEFLQPCYTIEGNSVSCDWSANGYRLPTEAEWEYAARGGDKSMNHVYSGANDLDAVGWYLDNSAGMIRITCTKAANEIDLYDMSGNVWEWVWDMYDASYYSKSPESDPYGPEEGMYRVLRGGSWNCEESYCRVSFREYGKPDGTDVDIGLRVARGRL